jgi:hypothetical protein
MLEPSEPDVKAGLQTIRVWWQGVCHLARHFWGAVELPEKARSWSIFERVHLTRNQLA